MGFDYRRFGTSYPQMRIYNTAHTNLIREINWSELDNEVSGLGWNWVAEDQAEPFKTQKGTVYEYPLGHRLVATVNFRIWSEEFTALPQSQQNGETFAFTERDMHALKEYRRVGGHIYFYPHREWGATFPHDDRFRVRILDLSANRPDGKTLKVECSLTVEGMYAVTWGYPEANKTIPDDF